MLTVHRAERADTLVAVLADVLTTPLADPMATEVIAVPERGVERWLGQQLSLQLGIAANIAFDSPSSLLRQATAVLADDPDEAQAWYADRLRWPVLRVLDEHIGDERLAVLAAHIGVTGDAERADLRRGRRFSTAATIAGLFGAYGWQRPSMIADWAAGRDTDGAGAELAPHLRWQPWFWRLVREQVGRPHPAEDLAGLTERLREDPGVVDFPERLSLFGPTRIPQTLHAVLDALAVHRDVSLYLPHPSDALWRTIAKSSSGQQSAGPNRPGLRLARESRDGAAAGHPLLAALSRDVQEMQETLAPSIGDDVHHDGSPRPDTVLGALQDGLRDDRLAPMTTPPDESVQVHACHGAERQVEVLRDSLLHLFADDPTLEPRDVLVMCPDVESYAPLIRGAFGQTGMHHPAYKLRVRLADRGLRESNAVLDVVARTLDLAAGRVRSGELLDLASSPPVRARFGFTDADIDSLASWIRRSGVRWGLDSTQRERFGLGGFPQGTVATGLDRMLLGVVAEESENEWLATALPLAGIDSTDTDLVGRFAELCDRLATIASAVADRHTIGDWADLLNGAVDALTDVTDDGEWQRAQAVGMIGDALTVDDDGAGTELELGDVRDLIAGLVAARPTRSNFCTGELTVCSMVPMRSVPHRVIALLGMDTGVYPRPGALDGDDALAVRPLVGERDRRDEDRQTFLDAICAAGEHLLVFYTGADPLTGTRLPPAVVVSELLDAVDVVVGRDSRGSDAESPVVHRHTLHAFDERNFVDVDGRGPLSFDPTLLSGACALRDATRSELPAPALPRVSDARPGPPALSDVDLDELIAFLSAPVEGFARQRLGLGIPEEAEEYPDQLAVSLDGLEKWGVGNRYLQALLDGRDPVAAQGAELRRGTLPPFAFGTAVFGPIRDKAQAVATAAHGYRSDSADAVDVRVDLPGGRRLYGTVGDVFDGRLVPVSYSRLGAKHRLAAWIRVLAMAASGAVVDPEAVVVGGTGGFRPSARMSRLAAPRDASEILAVLVAIRDAGLTAPIGLTLEAAEAAAAEFDRSGNERRAMNRASWAYRSSYSDPNRYAGLVFHGDPGAHVSFDELCVSLPDPSALSSVEQWLPGTPTTPMYVRLAAAVFGPLRRNEEDR
ncbi:exodeoxyribonuclease V subunit gamma [Gordonia liuliyuniae]|uniref:RecBCD enzyme subunit RecC n=1 Tax=Gordonia liuliyuniae TaxID=2911517 RepID=A0ABS9IQB5_9ACTN|nr:exodeoxyribonuclease V subunit gamma [Gordonia liuliyuniae]MCF8587751.1 exodeoxyribonuclease V subunit gamma [Gordonia liuliyuniae]